MYQLIDELSERARGVTYPYMLIGKQGPWCVDLQEIAEAVHELGYRHQRRIVDVDELDDLAEGSIILDESVTATKFGQDWLYEAGYFEPRLPVTLLFEPGVTVAD